MSWAAGNFTSVTTTTGEHAHQTAYTGNLQLVFIGYREYIDLSQKRHVPQETRIAFYKSPIANCAQLYVSSVLFIL
jgi:hypothetical protein